MSAEPVTWTTQHGDVVEVYRLSRLGHYDCPESCPDVTFRWRVRAANNRIVESGEGHTRRAAAVKAAERHHPRQVES